MRDVAAAAGRKGEGVRSKIIRPATIGVRKRRRVFYGAIAVVVAAFGQSSLALAHEGEPLAPHDLWRAWNWDLLILASLALAGWRYAGGVGSLWQRAGSGRGVSGWRVAAFSGGLLALFIALISPLDALSGALFSAHMVQHLLLMMVAAPLLVLGAPPVALTWALPQRWRARVGRWWHGQTVLRSSWQALSHPAAVWGLYMSALWVWHLPLLYEAALRSEFIHFLEHGCFLAAAVLFWWTLARCPLRGRLSYGAGILYVFTTALHSGLLGSLLTFTPRLWYPIYAASTPGWGLTPLEDQQLAGVTMWVPMGIIYTIAALALLGVWLQVMERKERRQREGVWRAKEIS